MSDSGGAQGSRAGGERWLRAGAALLLGAFLLQGLPDLGRHLPNPDEGIDYRIAFFAGPAEARAAIRGNAHPPFYYALLRGIAAGLPAWGFEAELVALRLPSLLAAALALAAVFGAGRRWLDTRTGLLAALLMAGSGALREQAELVRPYTLLVAAIAGALWALAGTLRQREGRSALALAGCLVLACGVHYSGLLVLAAFAGAIGLVALRSPADRRGAALAAGALAPAAGLSGWLYVTHIHARLEGGVLQAEARAGWLAPFFPDVLELPASLLYVFGYLFGVAFALVGLGVCALGAWRAARAGRLAVAALPVLALALGAVLAVAGRYPFGGSRHVLYLLPLLVLPMAHGALTMLRSGRAVAFGVAVALAVAAMGPLSALLASDPRPPWLRPVEQITDWRAHAGIGRQLARLRGTPGFVLMPRTSFLTLLPLLRPDIREFRRDAARSLFVFGWGERTVFVHEGWELTAAPAARDAPQHLARFLARVSDTEEGRAIHEAETVALVVSGWSQEIVAELAEADAALPPARRRIRRAVQAPGYAGLILQPSFRNPEVR